MGTDIVIYAEVYDGTAWKAKPTSLEQLDCRFFEVDARLEPRSIYFERARDLYPLLAGDRGINLRLATPKQLDRYRASSRMQTQRSFPDDVSDELLDHYCRDYCDCRWEEVIPLTVRQEAKKNQEVSWLSLEELNRLDWSSSQGWGYGEVEKKHAALFGDGTQPWQPAMYDKLLQWVYYPLRSKAPSPNNYVCEPGYVQVSWIEIQPKSYAETAGTIFMQQFLPLLRTYGSPQDVRIVFWLNV